MSCMLNTLIFLRLLLLLSITPNLQVAASLPLAQPLLVRLKRHTFIVFMVNWLNFLGDTQIFIYPPYEFGVVDCLITNFHLPKSTLLMLVSAFAGTQTIQEAYNHAIKNKYRFFSYGDAMFLEKAQ